MAWQGLKKARILFFISIGWSCALPIFAPFDVHAKDKCFALTSAAGLLGPDADRDPPAAFSRAYLRLLPSDLSRSALEKLATDPLDLPNFSTAAETVNQGAELSRLIHDYLPRLSDPLRQDAVTAIKAALQEKINTANPDHRRANPAPDQRAIYNLPIVWQAHSDELTSLSISNDDQFVFSSALLEPGKLWDIRTGQFIRNFEDVDHHAITTAAFSPDSTLLAIASREGTLALWDVATGKRLANHPIDGRVRAIAFTHDGTQVLCAAGRMIYSWNIKTSLPEKPFEVDSGGNVYEGLSVSPDDSLLLAYSSMSPGRAGPVWKMSDRTIKFALMTPGRNQNALSFSKDGRTIRGLVGNSLFAWNASDGQYTAESRPYIPFGNYLAISPDESTVVMSSNPHGEIHLSLDLKRLNPELILTTGAWTPHLKFSSDGSLLALGSNDGKIRIFNLALRREDSRVHPAQEVPK